MKYLRLSTVSLLLVLIMLTALSTTADFVGLAGTGIGGTFYIASIIALFLILFPPLSRLPLVYPLAVGFIMFLLMQMYWFTVAATSQTAVVLAIGELALLIAGTLAAHKVGQQMVLFEDGVDQVARSVVGIDAPSLQEAAPVIEREMMRSRHHDRPLSLVVLDYPAKMDKVILNKMIADIQRRTVYRYQTAVLANAVSQRLRAMDVLLKADEGRLFILCPELSAEETAWLCKQLEKNIATDMGLDVRCAASVFPGEGLTFDGLQDTAVGKLGQAIDVRHQTKNLKKSSSPVIS